MSSFHTEVKGNFYRYNDDEWEKKFLEGKVPDRPAWVYAYLADSNGNVGDPAIVLKGVEYTGTDFEEKEVQALSYLLAYPNPASREVHFRFILRDESLINAEVFDVTGRKTNTLYSGVLPAAEHDLQMDLSDRSPGVYFIRLHVNEQLFVKRFIVQ